MKIMTSCWKRIFQSKVNNIQNFKKHHQKIKMKMFVTFFSLTYPPMIDSQNEIFTLKLLCNKFEDFIHFSMTYLLHTSEAFQHFLFYHWEQHDAKVSVKMISESHVSNISSYILWDEIFATIHCSEKFIHTISFPTSSPTTLKHLSIERHFIISSNWSHSQINTKQTPCKRKG